MKPPRRALIILAALSASLALAQSQGGNDAQVRQNTDQQIKTEFKKILGDKVDNLSEKGQQDIETLAKNMDPGQRQAAGAKLKELGTKAADPGAKARIADALTSLARQTQGKESVELAREALRVSDQPDVRAKAEAVLRLNAREAGAEGAAPASPVAAGKSPQQAMVNNIYVIMVNDSQKGKELAGRFSRGQVEFRTDSSGRLKDSVVDAAWEGEGHRKHLVVNIDGGAMAENKNTPATLAPLVAKALSDGDFVRQHGDGMVSRVQMALEGYFSGGKVGAQIQDTGKNPMDTQKSTAGRMVGFFVDLFRGNMTQPSYTQDLNPSLPGAKLNIAMRRDAVERFAAIAQFREGPRDTSSGAVSAPSYYTDLTAAKDRLRKEP